MLSRSLGCVVRRWRLVVTALVAVVALVAGCVVAVQVAGRGGVPVASPGAGVPVRVVRGHRVRVPVMRGWRRPVSVWPAAGSAVVAVPAPAGRVAGRVGAGPSAGSVRAGGEPVWVGPVPAAAATSAVVRGGAAGVVGVSRVRVSVASQKVARVLGVRGVVLSLAQAGAGGGLGRVHVAVSYAGFGQAFGGGYGSRLELVELPGCALTRPGVAGCRVQKLVGSVNDARRDWVGADVALPGGVAVSAAFGAGGVRLTSAVSGAGVVLAVVAGASGSAGDFGAEPLSEATNDWVSGGSSGAYTYSYPVGVPPVPGGLVPSVALGYDSQATSGLSSSTNNQASWVGQGFDYEPGFIETDYATCSQQALEPVTGDLCPGKGEVALSLGGQVTPLVDGSSGWRAEDDSGAQIKQSGTSWEVIEPDGTQYWFGVNELPGWAAGDPVTNSVWDVPVWEGCHQAAFCKLPWRLNLDYVVDSHGNAMAYFYSTQTNYYAESDGSTGTGAYTQGGVLTKIEYGLRAGQVYAATPAAQVLFTSAGGRADAPADLSCSAGAACAVTSPTFWNDDELTSITTQALVGGTLRNVDSWALAGSYPATGDPSTSPSLWLSSVTRTGLDGSSAVTLPPVSFAGTPLANRVMTAADTAAGYSALTEFYLTSVTADTGAVTTVGYSAPDPAPCAAGSFPAPDANTAACYPDYWVPAGGTAAVLDWFNLFSVTVVAAADTTGGDPAVVTSYAYGGAGWHYDQDTISRSAVVTWDVWRGWQQVTAQTGTAPGPVTETVDTFLQGMSQDGPAASPGPVVTVATSRGQQVTDDDQFAGMPLEEVVYDGAGSGQVVSDTVSLPWSSAATAVNTALDQAAYMTGAGSVLTYTPLAGGTTRESTQDYTYNSYGLVASDSSVPDTASPGEDTCATTTYAVNTGTWLVDLPAAEVTDAGACNAAGNGTGALVSQTDDFYDGQALGAGPSAGNLTKSEQAVAAGSFDTSTATYDEYGRVLTATDPDERHHHHRLHPGHRRRADVGGGDRPDGPGHHHHLRPGPGPAADRDQTRRRYATTTAYDALGRLTAEWTPGNPASGPATTTYAYTVSDTAPSVTTEQDLEPGGNYLTTDTLDDSLGQVREVQQETAGGGSDVTDTTYNSDGRQALVSRPVLRRRRAVRHAGRGRARTACRTQTGYVYDGDGRVIRQIAYDDGTETWETDTAYGGDYDHRHSRRRAARRETTWTDGRGLTTAI